MDRPVVFTKIEKDLLFVTLVTIYASRWKIYKPLFERLPLLIGPDSYAPGVNEPVLLYRGEMSLQLETGTLPVDGEVFFSWRPRPGVRFRGAIDRYTLDFNIKNMDLPGKRITQGQAMITHIGGADGSVTGVINNPFVFKVQESAGRLTFQLPNFRAVIGEPVRSQDRMYASRIILEDAEWLIKLDRQPDADEKVRKLKQEGGYGLTVCGEAFSKTGVFDYERSRKVISDLGLFLTFLNGRRCYPCLIRAWGRNGLAWEDCSSYHADEYKEEYAWLPQRYDPSWSDLWQSFTRQTSDAAAQECLDLLIHWYVEANNNSGFAEGAIVFMQNAFELLYNWQIGPPPKGKKVDAAGKLRALLNRASIPTQVPAAYQRITADLKAKGIHVADLPELFTRVRNAIVHSDNNKRKTLRNIPSMDSFHIRHLGLYCLELLILFELDYRGKFANRISLNKYVGGNEETVPWV